MTGSPTDPPVPTLAADEVERIRARHWLNYTWTDNITGTVSPVCACARNAPYPCDAARLLDALAVEQAGAIDAEADNERLRAELSAAAQSYGGLVRALDESGARRERVEAALRTWKCHVCGGDGKSNAMRRGESDAPCVSCTGSGLHPIAAAALAGPAAGDGPAEGGGE
jgi:hypothetical protein